MKRPDPILAGIAREHLRIPTLASRQTVNRRGVAVVLPGISVRNRPAPPMLLFRSAIPLFSRRSPAGPLVR